MGKALCFVPEQLADYEVILAVRLLKHVCGKEIATVGYSKKPVTSLSGVRYTADITLAEAAALDDIEAFIIPGGPIVQRNEELSSFLRALDRQGALLAAICYGPHYLARSGLLETHRYTTSCTPEDIRKLDIADPFPRGMYVNERVVTDGNIITAMGYAFVDFAFAIARYIGFNSIDEPELEQFFREIMDR